MNFLKYINTKLDLSEKDRAILKLFEIESNRAIDILLNFPYKYNPKKYIRHVYELVENEQVIIKVKISHICQDGKFLKIKLEFDSSLDFLELIFFKFNIGWIKANFQIQKEIFISGKLVLQNIKKNNFYSFQSCSKEKFQIIHPEILKNFDPSFFVEKDQFYSTPIYHSVKEINNDVMRSFVLSAFKVFQIQDLQNDHSEKIFSEWLPKKILEKFGFMNFFEALKILHQFGPDYKVYNQFLISKAKNRIMFDEFFIKHLMNKILKKNLKMKNGRMIEGDFSLRNKVFKCLGFDLTKDQKRILENEIYPDQANISKMNRILQGDVGSGKTVLAMFAILNSAESGLQSIFMCPTEILAKQHFESFQKVFEKAEILFDEDSQNLDRNENKKYIELIFLSSKAKKRIKTLKKIEQNPNNTLQIIIGTHAVFQEKVKFREIGLVVIDEQHRFGVKARQDLSEKDSRSDVLLMSATPIPRTLAMTCFGYLDHSILKEKPANRKKVLTSVLNSSRIEEIFSKIKKIIERGEKVYWICPLIQESLKLDLIAIEKRFEILKSFFPESEIGVVHGKMTSIEIEEAMMKFKNGEKKILLATTVVEVGVNVCDATLIVIEEAQRFGLSQLHQLRGRVGRSQLQSYCILLYNSSSVSKQSFFRLKNLAETEDGFEIAELDLEIRGSGEFNGLKQSGSDEYICGDPAEHKKLFKDCEEFAENIFNFFDGDFAKISQRFGCVMEIFSVDQRKV